MNSFRRGFTLIEMMVIAPIVILLIGSFIALLVNLTGEVLSSRGSNTMTYEIQDALNRIEEDVKLSTTFLAVNNISVATTKQGYGNDKNNGSTVNFTNIKKSGGSNASLIINGIVTNGNPMSATTRFVYLANSPNDCSDPALYNLNTPMTMNIVYFVDDDNILWRRVIMPSNYNDPASYCEIYSPTWQQASCIVGYNATSMPYCRTNDIRLLDGVSPTDFSIQYFASADTTAADTTANNTSITDDSVRNTALQSTPTVNVSITARKNIAGRNITGSGSVRVTRLDTNASSIATQTAPTSAPALPVVSAKVTDGDNVTFTWPRVAGASSYDLDFRINGGAWQNNSSTIDMNNDTRSYTVTSATHTDTVEARVRATNSFGDSGYSSASLAIPLWVPLVLTGSWTDYGETYATAAYTKTKSGVIILKGLIKGGTGLVATLPPNYRPEKSMMFATSSNGAGSRLDVRPNGEIFMSTGSSTWLSLDSVTYRPAGTTFTNLAYQNSWTTYDSNWDRAGYSTDASGRVHTRGLIANGVTTSGTPMITIPAAILNPEYTHQAQVSASAVAYVSSEPSTSAIIAKGAGNNTHLSINTMYYPSSRANGTTCTTQWCTLSLLNGWTYFGAPYTTPKYTKGSDGIVSIKGLIRNGSAATMATIPAGYCPSKQLVMTIISSNAWGRADIVPQSNGTCLIYGFSYNASWLSLDSIRYMAE